MDPVVKRILAMITAALVIGGTLPTMFVIVPLLLLLNQNAKDQLNSKLEDLKADNGGNEKFVKFLEKIQSKL